MSAGSIAVEYGVWESNVSYDGFTLSFAADFDGDGDVDILVANAFGEWIAGPYFLMNDDEANLVADTSRVPEEGLYRDENVTLLSTPGFFTALGGNGQVVTAAVHDFNGDGRPDILLGGYRFGTWVRGVQLLMNDGERGFVDETVRRLGASAWSATESWHWEYRGVPG